MLGRLVEVAHAVVVAGVLVDHATVRERGVVLWHRAQLGQDILTTAQEKADAILHHQDRRLWSSDGCTSKELRQVNDLGCITEFGCDGFQMGNAEAIGSRCADHLHAVLVLSAVTKRDGERLVGLQSACVLVHGGSLFSLLVFRFFLARVAFFGELASQTRTRSRTS